MSRIALAAVLAATLPLGANAQGRGAHDLERGLVAAYPLDGDAVDVVTRTRPVAQAVRPADGHDGQRGGALQFDGARSYLNLGDRIDAPRFTIAAWIRPDVIDRPQAILSKVRNLPGHWQKNFELRLDPGGRVYLQLPSGAAWDGVAGVRPLAPGRWAHVAAVYDGLRAQLFVDGMRDGAPLEVTYAQTRTETFVGARPEGGGRDGRVPSGPTFFFTGAIEDVRVYDRPLSDAELQAVVTWRAQPPRQLPPEPPPVATRPPAAGAEVIASYPLDGDAQDATGGADGTVVGAKPAEGRLGDARGALAFTGREYVDLGVRGAPERFTLAAWIRPARISRELVVFSKWTGAPGGRDGWLELRVDPGGRVALAAPGGGPRGQGLRSDRKVAPNRWTHVAASFDGDRAVIYVDGEIDAEGTLEPFDAPRGPVFLGARPDASGRRARPATGFDGRLDDVSLWRGAAADEQIALAARDREAHGRRPGNPEDFLIVKVDRMIARYDVACVRRDQAALEREEAGVVGELEEVAKRDRDAAPRVRRASGELQRLRGRTDAMSLDKKRGALFELSDALWNDLARDLDGDRRDDRRDRRDDRDAGWF